MATGKLNSDGAPVVPVELAGQVFEAVIDTGFEGGFQLPASLFGQVSLTPYRQVEFELGAGQKATVTTFWVPYSLDGVEYLAEAFFAASDQVLLGLDVLKDYRLEI